MLDKARVELDGDMLYPLKLEDPKILPKCLPILYECNYNLVIATDEHTTLVKNQLDNLGKRGNIDTTDYINKTQEALLKSFIAIGKLLLLFNIEEDDIHSFLDSLISEDETINTEYYREGDLPTRLQNFASYSINREHGIQTLRYLHDINIGNIAISESSVQIVNNKTMVINRGIIRAIMELSKKDTNIQIVQTLLIASLLIHVELSYLLGFKNIYK